MNSRVRFFLFFMISMLFFASTSCKSKKVILKKSIHEYGFDYLYAQLTKNQLKFNTLTARFNLSFEMDKQKTSLRGQYAYKTTA